MNETSFIKHVIKMVLLLALIICACRITQGIASLAVAIMGGFYALQGKPDKFLVCYLLLPFMIILNPTVLGASGQFYLFTRIGNFFLIAMAIFQGMTGMKNWKYSLPIGFLFLYIGVACLSSATGWFPLISYLKLFNYLFFIGGLYYAANGVQKSDNVLYQIRVIFMAFAIVVVFGSLALLPFPGIAYRTSALHLFRQGLDISEINAQMAESRGMKLFAGITNHSQTLGPLSVGLVGWVLCDMMFVMRKFSKLHVAILAVAPIVFYMTRSRTAIVSFSMIVFLLFFYAMNRVRMSLRAKNSIRRLFVGFTVIVALGAGVAEIKSGAMTRLLRKTDDATGDQRGLLEAMTNSRMGKIEILMQDFYRNPLLGMGFQVEANLRDRYKAGHASLLSASVEKGNVFVTVLAETGIIGSLVFLAFLIRFYSYCVRFRCMALLALFTFFLTANLGEAIFFSPTATGGVLWCAVAIGGFAVDLASKRRTEREMMGFRG